MTKLNIKIFLILLSSSLFFAQTDIDRLINDVYKGNLKEAEESIHKLRTEFPENPSLLFLLALIDNNPDRSIEKYKELFNLYPDSKYADDAVMKVSEYYYTKGLYVKSADWSKKINLYYSDSEHINRSLKMYIRGATQFSAMGETLFLIESS